MFTLPHITLPGIDEYAEKHSAPEPADLSGTTGNDLGLGHLISGQLVSGLLRTLIHTLQPRLVLDIGTFTGYSALTMASAMPAGSHLITLEADPTHAAVAQKNIEASPYADKVELRVGPALEALESIDGPLDMVFIDADKPNYHNYFLATLPKLAPNGLIVCDNTLWRGEVLDDSSTDPDVRAIQAFNDAVAADPRVEPVLLTLRDGVTLIRHASKG